MLCTRPRRTGETRLPLLTRSRGLDRARRAVGPCPNNAPGRRHLRGQEWPLRHSDPNDCYWPTVSVRGVTSKLTFCARTWPTKVGCRHRPRSGTRGHLLTAESRDRTAGTRLGAAKRGGGQTTVRNCLSPTTSVCRDANRLTEGVRIGSKVKPDTGNVHLGCALTAPIQ